MRNGTVRAVTAALLAATALASASTAGAAVSPHPRFFGKPASAKPDVRFWGHRPEAVGRICRGCGPEAIGRFGRPDRPEARFGRAHRSTAQL